MINNVTLVGNVGGDPEVKHLDSGSTVARFSLATEYRYKDKQGEVHKKTEWHTIVAWRGLAEVVEKYIKKGMQIFIHGRIEYQTYQDSNGQNRYSTHILANEVKMLGRKEGSSRPFPEETSPVSSALGEPKKAEGMTGGQDFSDIDDDLPF